MRRILGVAAASLAAPFLLVTIVIVLGYLAEALEGGFYQPRLGWRIANALILYGVGAIIVFPIPLLVTALISGGLASLLEGLGFRSRLPFMAGGAVMGTALMLWITGNPGALWSGDYWPLFAGTMTLAALAGSLCGWIYWRIAIARTPENARAIEAE